MITPVHDCYFADPFVLRVPGRGYVAYGSGPPAGQATRSDHVFHAMTSDDLQTWRPRGPVLERLPDDLGDEYWAPEVAYADGTYWMYYSVGHGITGHHLRVACADDPLGPFADLGLNLTPGETFAIDAHPFQDHDGRWYLYCARDVLDADRPGTHLAVAPLATMTELDGPLIPVLAPNDDWQIYQRDRAMYGGRYDWHTLEGPAVARRHGRYWLTYSGGAWTGPGYAVSWAVADHPLGPWHHAPVGTEPLLHTGFGGLVGPGHNSITTTPTDSDVIAFHAWDVARTTRRMHIGPITFTEIGPRVSIAVRTAPRTSTMPTDRARP